MKVPLFKDELYMAQEGNWIC